MVLNFGRLTCDALSQPLGNVALHVRSNEPLTSQCLGPVHSGMQQTVGDFECRMAEVLWVERPQVFQGDITPQGRLAWSGGAFLELQGTRVKCK